MSDIFISYAREDFGTARMLAGVLERRGWSVWWDRRIRTGESFDEVIEEALDAASCVIVVWSSHSVGSDWVRIEAGDGADRGILAPVRIEDVRVPLRLRRLHTTSLIDWDGADDAPDLQRLIEDLETILGPPTPTEESDGAKERPKKARPPRPTSRKTAKPAKPEPGAGFRHTLKDGSAGPEMVVIPAGAFCRETEREFRGQGDGAKTTGGAAGRCRARLGATNAAPGARSRLQQKGVLRQALR